MTDSATAAVTADDPPPGWAGTGRITGPGDVARAVASAVNTAGTRRARTTDRIQLVDTADRADTAYDPATRTWPVRADVRQLLPWPGLRRGATVSIVGSYSLLLAAMAQASADGAWCAVVGVADLNPGAAAEIGVDLDRLVLIPEPGARWPEVVNTVLGGADLVAVGLSGPVSGGVARSLAGRVRRRGTVLLPVRRQWPGSDLTLTVTGRRWHGPRHGPGRLRACELTVEAHGRGAASRPTRTSLWLPSHTDTAPWPITTATPAGQPGTGSRPDLAVVS